jgi:hypothetical protein
MINDVFPHVGEAILERIINHDPSFVLEKLGLAENKFIGVHRQISIEFPKSGVIFDGFSTIDLGLQLVDDIIFPIEVKLGHPVLARATMNLKLKPCSVTAHTSEPRIGGNILAVTSVRYNSCYARHNPLQYKGKMPNFSVTDLNSLQFPPHALATTWREDSHVRRPDYFFSDYGSSSYARVSALCSSLPRQPQG